MPRYTFTTPDGDSIELVLTVKEYDQRVKDGRITVKHKGRTVVAERNFAGDACTLGTPAKSGWPMHSEAAGVWPGQQKEAEAEASKLGVPTKFDTQGRAVFTDPKHRKRYLKAHSMHDRSGYD